MVRYDTVRHSTARGTGRDGDGTVQYGMVCIYVCTQVCMRIYIFIHTYSLCTYTDMTLRLMYKDMCIPSIINTNFHCRHTSACTCCEFLQRWIACRLLPDRCTKDVSLKMDPKKCRPRMRGVSGNRVELQNFTGYFSWLQLITTITRMAKLPSSSKTIDSEQARQNQLKKKASGTLNWAFGSVSESSKH